MKKILLIALVGLSFISKGQNLFTSFTSQKDNYMTLGYTGKNGWGVYGGFDLDDPNKIDVSEFALGKSLKLGGMKMFYHQRAIVGLGVIPRNDVFKPNLFLGIAPLKSNGFNLWVIGNMSGRTFSPGLGLTYNIDRYTKFLNKKQYF